MERPRVGSWMACEKSSVSSTRREPRQRAQPGDYRSAYLARHTRFLQMSEKKPPQAPRQDFAGKIGIINLATQAIAPLPRSLIESVFISASSGLRGFFKSRS